MTGDGFDPGALTRRLRMFPVALEAVARSFTDAEARWRPDASRWSVLEVINHLADEEVDDFPKRIRLLIEDPAREWPPIDPEGWARERKYNERAMGESIERFVNARRASMAWLDTLGEVDWMVHRVHPKFGPMHAGMLLASWCAHDGLHMRQILKRRHEMTVRDAGGFTTQYAGAW